VIYLIILPLGTVFPLISFDKDPKLLYKDNGSTPRFAARIAWRDLNDGERLMSTLDHELILLSPRKYVVPYEPRLLD
jgi:hypothetical protein